MGKLWFFIVIRLFSQLPTQTSDQKETIVSQLSNTEHFTRLSTVFIFSTSCEQTIYFPLFDEQSFYLPQISNGPQVTRT